MQADKGVTNVVGFLHSAFMKAIAVVAGLAMLTTSTHAKEAALTPDLVIVNATVRTMDEKNPTATALAIYGNQIVVVGKSEEVRALAGKSTRIIDAGKKLVLPGFNDSHVHFLMGGYSLSNV